MNDYVLLYVFPSGSKMPDSPAEQAAVMQEWGAWLGKMGSGLKDGGNPFTGKAKTIASDGNVSDGAAAMASGYLIIKADSLDAAVAMAKGCPVLKSGAKISVCETFKVM